MFFDDVNYPDEFKNEEERFAMIRFLEAEGYVEIIKSTSTKSHLGIRLSHKGIKRKEFRRQEVIKYLEEKWIDFFAMAVSAAALVISIVALLSKSQG